MRKKPLVFVVDDDALIRNNLERYLSQSGWEVKAISDGFEVLLLCMYLIPDLIISDMRMPKLDGITLLQGLHNNEQTKKIPVILMSAFATDELMEKAKDLGAEFYRGRPSARAAVSKWRKLDSRTVPIHCKAAANYLSPLVAKQEVLARGFDIPILLTTAGFVAEGATESLFLVKRRVIKTAPLEFVLPGITRRSVLEVARVLGYTVLEKKMRLPELLSADEAFYTSTSQKVWPIASIERKKLPAPGPVAAHLMETFQKITAGQVPRFKKWLVVTPPWK